MFRFLLSAAVITGALGYRLAPASQPQPLAVRTFQAGFDRITPEGTVVRDDGEELRLARIRMRSIEQTLEPALLDVVNDVIARESRIIDVELHVESNTVVAYYKQRVVYMTEYVVPLSMAMNAVKPTTMGTVNELLIVMAAAEYDPTVGRMTKEAQLRCEDASLKAEEAFWSRYRYRPLREYERSSAQLCTNRDGYRARIAKGDVAARDRAIAEYRARAATTECGKLGSEGERTPNLTPECLADFMEALGADNRFVRRFAAYRLARLATP
jgi:hypothetical protein